MSTILRLLSAMALACVLATPVSAQLNARKDLSLSTALTIAQSASETCRAKGWSVSVHVVGRLGEVVVALRGDDASPHTMENSFRKAYTARTLRVPTGEFVTRVQKNPTLGHIHLANIVAARGGLPINAGNGTIGAVGVSGAPGGQNDEICAQSGIDKVATQLK